MGLYMSTAKLTAEAIQAYASNPSDRRVVLNQMLESIGGKLISYYFAFGDADVVVIGEAPDNVSMASALLAVAGAGTVADVKTTVLMSYEEGAEALQRSASVAYSPPGS